MAGRIGGRLEDMGNVDLQLQNAALGSEAGAQTAGTRVQEVINEVTDVSDLMITQFGTLATELNDVVTQAGQTLEGSDWDGSSNAAAQRAEIQFRADINNLLTAANTGAENLKSAMLEQSTSFHEEVTGKFTTMMATIQGNYEQLALGTRTFANHINEGDQAIIKF